MSLPPECSEFLRSTLDVEWEVRSLAGDASARSYHRIVLPERSMVLAYYPEELRRDLRRVLEAQRSLSEVAAVPAIYETCEHSLLQEDVGDVTLFEVVRNDREAGLHLYRRAVKLLIDFQRAPESARNLNPPFDSAKFFDELLMTVDWYVDRLSGGITDPERSELIDLLRAVSDEIAAHPYVLCHRDYHGQNIHVRDDHLYLIDFQDLRMGPDTYDLASLLRDRGIVESLGRQNEASLVGEYARLIGAREEEIRDRYAATLLQRSVKILGTFAKQAISRGRSHYLDYIPAALETVGFCTERLPRYAGVARLLPVLATRRNA